MKKQLLLTLTILCVSGLNADQKDFEATGTDKKESEYQSECEGYYNDGYNDGYNDKENKKARKTSKRSKSSTNGNGTKKNLGSRMDREPSLLGGDSK